MNNPTDIYGNLSWLNKKIEKLICLVDACCNSGGSITGSGTTNYITKWTSSSALGNSLIYDNGSNVGIGTATPNEKFTVNGNIQGSYIIANNDLYGVNLRVNGIYANSLTYLPFYSSVNPFGEIMRVQNNGNVLIGTTTDSGYKLTVGGISKFTSDLEITGYNDFLLPVDGGIKIYSNSTSQKSYIQAGKRAVVGYELNIGGVPIIFRNSTSDVEIGRFSSNNNLLINTTTDSGYKLDLVGSQRIVSSSGIPFTVRGGVNSYIEVSQTGYDCAVYLGVINTSGNWGRVGTINNYDFALMTNNSPVATATKEGNFLVGTTTNITSSKLTIESTTQGILIPRMTTAQIKNNIASPVKGLMAFSNDDNVLAFYDGTAWRKVNHATL